MISTGSSLEVAFRLQVLSQIMGEEHWYTEQALVNGGVLELEGTVWGLRHSNLAFLFFYIHLFAQTWFLNHHLTQKFR